MKTKRLFLGLLLAVLTINACFGQTATQVLDRCAAKVSSQDGATANFAMTSAQYGDAQGTISIKGQMFRTQTGTVSMWFDGTTLWTYMAQNDEVNISTPNDQQLQTLNPYNFINMYRSGFSTTMNTTATTFVVHLTATDQQRRIREAFITVDKTSYAPKEIKMLQGNRWTTFTISNLRTERLADTMFRFDHTAYPNAEVIDLR
ncbi:MAG: cell envelope biogenesis protein LolA [Prevotella sp.]|nr:cell envelope biogenesis protein LolA [Prevotella sp.]